jgi:hypothetical protein
LRVQIHKGSVQFLMKMGRVEQDGVPHSSELHKLAQKGVDYSKVGSSFISRCWFNRSSRADIIIGAYIRCIVFVPRGRKMAQRKIRTAQLDNDVSVEQVVAQQHEIQEIQASPTEVIYRPVPRIPDLPGEAYIPRHWRIQFVGEGGEVMGADVYDDVILGRGQQVRDRTGIDFTGWGAQDKGVSREHALLRPTPTCLYLVDIGSTNGTFHNVERVTPGVARELANGDIVVLGRLVLTLRIMHSPQDEPPVFAPVHLPGVKEAGSIRSG